MDGKAAAEITGRRRVGYPTGADCVEVNFVVSQPLYVFKALAVAQNVKGDVKNVVGFKVGVMQLENMKIAIDGLVQFQLLDEHLYSAYSAVDHTPVAIRDFVMDIAGFEHRLDIGGSCSLVEAFANFVLALSELFCYFLFHSK